MISFVFFAGIDISHAKYFKLSLVKGLPANVDMDTVINTQNRI